VRETILEPGLPVRYHIRLTKDGLDPNLTGAHLDGAGRHVIGPKIEGAATCEIEAGVVPRTGQDAVPDTPTLKGEAHVWTAVVQGRDLATIIDNEDWTVRTLQDQPTLDLQLGEVAGVNEVRATPVHSRL